MSLKYIIGLCMDKSMLFIGLNALDLAIVNLTVELGVLENAGFLLILILSDTQIQKVANLCQNHDISSP